MKRYTPFIIFLLIIISSALAGVGSYRTTRNYLINDLNRALAQTLAEQKSDWITPDTIRACRQLQASQHSTVSINVHSGVLRKHLMAGSLKDKAVLQFTLAGSQPSGNNAEGLLQSDTIIWETTESGVSLAFRAQAPYTFATIFSLSDQRYSLSLFVLALLWLTASTLYRKKHREEENKITFGGLYYLPEHKNFCDCEGHAIYFTPMQQQLMELFFQSPDFQLSKETISRSLWPGKEDASETLYTLIKRLRPVLAQKGNLQIETNRGRSYKLIHSRV